MIRVLPRFSRWDGAALLLLLAVLGSAALQVWASARVRHQVSTLSHLQSRFDALTVVAVQLRLEEGARTTHGLVERAARERLGMVLPSASQVRLVQ